mgnify:CR=1 FL=1
MNKNNLIKDDIIKNLSNRSGFSTNLSKKIIDDLIEILINSIVNKGLNLKNLGSFNLLKKKERLGRNPKTKKEFIIKKRKSISFVASKKILEIINNNT